MNRTARLQSARHWLKTFSGKNVVRGYSRWFGVERLCAVEELTVLGLKIDSTYIEQLKRTKQNQTLRRQQQLAAQNRTAPSGGHLDQDETFFYIAGYTSGGAPFGITWEEQAELDLQAAESAFLEAEWIDRQCDAPY